MKLIKPWIAVAVAACPFYLAPAYAKGSDTLCQGIKSFSANLAKGGQRTIRFSIHKNNAPFPDKDCAFPDGSQEARALCLYLSEHGSVESMQHNLSEILSCFGNSLSATGASVWVRNLSGEIEIFEPFQSIKGVTLELEFKIANDASDADNFLRLTARRQE